MSKSILPSILDNDFYKFTMQHAVVKLFPHAKARYKFINRGKHAFPPNFAKVLQDAVDSMASIKLSLEEKRFLNHNCPYLDPVYLDFLQGYCYNPEEVKISQQAENLEVSIEGHWYRTILWEVPLMSLICELFYRETNQMRVSDDEIIQTTSKKAEMYRGLGVTIADFGTRRRHSFTVQDLVVKILTSAGSGFFVGSSNVHLAMKNNIKPIGTHAHEWFMFHAARFGYKMANSEALENWTNVYRGDLGIALSDTYTTKSFFTQFDKKLAKLFDGVRHDSNDPIEFAKMTIAHYQSLGIDPLSKTIIFSDALNYEKVARITEFCNGKIGFSFGIGTNLTNDVGLKAMNIVIKMTEAKPVNQDWTPVIKLSDEKGKYTGDPKEIELAKSILRIE
ncbi:nicotinate phosphoribosyltransferase [Desertivirga brevis]|uniref:nicotinate phosphoribosyltransferase n=1 Tax=Desertivirga brevis TaxID=2810310 RepID=UPI001A96C9B6|nr:nicotinate phosphoribosyltransferase [Pedobacter sp. SYSU D00873]